MRADRLVATLLFMQTRGRVTAAEVAAELEVSVATARRDLEALSTAGIPVYPQPGRHGGWSLIGGARTDLSGLSAAEARALFLLAGPTAVSGEAKAALRKLLRALPAPFRTEAEAAAGATLIDPTAWGEREKQPPDLVGLLQEAVIRRHRIRFTYRSVQRGTRGGEHAAGESGTADDGAAGENGAADDGAAGKSEGTAGKSRTGEGTAVRSGLDERATGESRTDEGAAGMSGTDERAAGESGRTGERVAEPWGVVDKGDVYYLIAGTPKGGRTFRVDRMSAVTTTGETFERPMDFDLDAAWGQVVGAVEGMRSRTWATLLIADRFVWVLRDHFGRHCEVLETRPDGRARVRVGAPEARDIARTLSGWGAAVEVLDPPAVRAELARIGAELVHLYQTPPPA